MSGAAGTAERPQSLADCRGMARAVPRPAVIPLLGAPWPARRRSSSSRAGHRQRDWAGVRVRAAVPLAILAGCQTLTMLTGGIDLSVGAVASMAGFVVATFVTGPGSSVGHRRRARRGARWPGWSTASASACSRSTR